MNCQELAARIEKLEPTSDPKDVARLCLLLSNTVGKLEELAPEDTLAKTWREMALRLQIATDQHAAMTEELENLAASDPQKFSPDQVWVLVRAIKVQSQVLQMYLGNPALDV